MSEKNLIHRNDKKHRKLVRSPDRLSPCEAENTLNSNSLVPHSSPTNYMVFPVNSPASSVSPSSQHHPANNKCARNYENFISSQQQSQQFPLQPQTQNLDYSYNVVSLAPSASAPTIALHRRPSITIKYSKNDETISYSSAQQSQSAQNAHSASSTKLNTNEQTMDQKCNNNFLINLNSIPACCLKNSSFSPPVLDGMVQQPANQQQFHQQQQINMIKSNPNFIYNFQNQNPTNYCGQAVAVSKPPTSDSKTASIMRRSMSPTALIASNTPSNHPSKSSDIYPNVFNHSPTSHSLNLNLINQLDNDNDMNLNNTTTASGNNSSRKLIFNSNNPFLNDNYDDTIDVISQNNGQCIDNFFNLSDNDNLNSENNFSLAVSKSAGMASSLIAAQNSAVASTNVIQTAKSLGEEDSQSALKKREQFSNASMKICLVVSPPTSKFIQVSLLMLLF